MSAAESRINTTLLKITSTAKNLGNKMLLGFAWRCQCGFFWRRINLARNTVHKKSAETWGRKLAARLGVEPRQNESESFVLPLHHRAVEKLIVTNFADAPGPFRRLAGGKGKWSGVVWRVGAPSKLEEREMEPAMGFEPATACLQNRCSTIELRRRKCRAR